MSGLFRMASWFLALAGLSHAAEVAAPIRVLILDGFSNHDWAHTTALIREVLEPTGKFRLAVATCPARPDDPGFASFQPQLADQDVVLVNCNSLGNGGQWPLALRADFVRFVGEGGGAFIFHSANNSFAGWAEYDRIIGLGWRGPNDGVALAIGPDESLRRIPPGQGKGTSHGPRGDRLVHRMGEHPIHAGLPRTWMAAMIEVYTYARGPAENLEVLSWAEDPASATRWPIEWTVRYGKGRVYNSTFGHVWKGETEPPGLRCAGFQTILVRALQWLANRPSDASPAGFSGRYPIQPAAAAGTGVNLGGKFAFSDSLGAPPRSPATAGQGSRLHRRRTLCSEPFPK